MNYWLTTHWPPYEDAPADAVAKGVWIPEGRQAAGAGFGRGDLVLIYHPQSGRTLIQPLSDGTTRHRRCQKGREGIVGVAEALDSIYALVDSVPEKYANGTETWWRWHAPLRLVSTSGFVPKAEVLKALGYASTYNFRGFGDHHSGLKRISESVFDTLLARFKESVPTRNDDTASFSHAYGDCGGESDAHRDLKHYVAANPSLVLAEPDVETLAVERPFPTGDRADVVLRDRFGGVIGVEIELDIPAGNIIGPLQAVKYRRMLEMTSGIRRGDGRSVLVAHTIPDDVRDICARYEVECRIVNRTTVENWRRSSGTLSPTDGATVIEV